MACRRRTVCARHDETATHGIALDTTFGMQESGAANFSRPRFAFCRDHHARRFLRLSTIHFARARSRAAAQGLDAAAHEVHMTRQAGRSGLDESAVRANRACPITLKLQHLAERVVRLGQLWMGRDHFFEEVLRLAEGADGQILLGESDLGTGMAAVDRQRMPKGSDGITVFPLLVEYRADVVPHAS